MYSDNSSVGADFYRRRDEAIRRMREMAGSADDSRLKPPPDYDGLMHGHHGERHEDPPKHEGEHCPAIHNDKPEDGHLPESQQRSIFKIFDRIKGDDMLLIGLLILLFNENSKDDYLMLLILAMLLFT